MAMFDRARSLDWGFGMTCSSSSFGCVFTPLCLSLLLASGASAQGAVPKFLFVANYADGTISVFRIQPLTGQLAEVPDSPFPGGTAIQGLALTPDKRFLYTSGLNLTAFSVNQQTGSLTADSTVTDGRLRRASC
jgi:6-phosphogluconolactonase (cycloisomerase 2 family)